MTPRLLLRTHYQADEPRIIVRLVTRCASATVSRHDETLAASLKKEVLGWNPHPAFGLPAAMYAVSNAQTLGFLNSSNRWTAPGLGLAFIESGEPNGLPAPSLDLSGAEARLYLVQYLLGTGALALHFGAWLLKERETSDAVLGRNKMIEKLIVRTLEDYLALARDAGSRSAIRRERDRLRETRYDEKTRRHKRRPIIATLRRLRLLQVLPDGATICPDGEGRLATLLRLIPNTEELERVAVRRDRLRHVVSQVYASGSGPEPAQNWSSTVCRGYQFAVGLGLQACPLEFLNDALFVGGGQDSSDDRYGGPAEKLLTELHQRVPREVRFHVDRRGRRAFVVLSDAGLGALQTIPLRIPARLEGE